MTESDGDVNPLTAEAQRRIAARVAHGPAQSSKPRGLGRGLEILLNGGLPPDNQQPPTDSHFPADGSQDSRNNLAGMTIDQLIDHLEKLRGEHGGQAAVVVAGNPMRAVRWLRAVTAAKIQPAAYAAAEGVGGRNTETVVVIQS